MNGSPGLIYMESVGAGQRHRHHHAHLRDRHQPRPGAGRRAEPPVARHAAPAGRGDAAGRARRQVAHATSCCSRSCRPTTRRIDPIALGDYASRNVLPEIQRVPGVGQAQLFGTERAMRIWIDPAKLVGFNLSPADVNAAIRAQNAQVSSGTIGDLPNVAGPGDRRHGGGQRPARRPSSSSATSCCAPTPTARPCACSDVARIELGGQAYATSARLNGKPSTGIGVQLVAERQCAGHRPRRCARKMDELARYFPQGVKYDDPVRQLALRRASRSREVVETLLEAVALVFLVMFLFLQNFRYTHHPDHRGAGRAAGHLRACCWRWASRSTC